MAEHGKSDRRRAATIDVVFFDAGGGHRSAAEALRVVADCQQRPWTVRLVNLQEQLDHLDVFRQATGVRLQDLYNRLLQRGWTWGSGPLLRSTQAAIRICRPAIVRALTQMWTDRRPDLVISVVPNFNRAMWLALRGVDRDIPFVTILTDLADYPPHFWIERGQDQYFVCGTAFAAQQARRAGHASARILETTGMLLHPKYYARQEPDRAAGRRRLGLDPERSTGLVLFGGQGSAEMETIVAQLQACTRDLQVILMCGRNAALAERLKRLPTRFPVAVEGFTSDMPSYMALADFFIGKPGPGSLSEALAMRLPLIVERNARTLAQERYNTQWIRDRDVGLVIDGFCQVTRAVDRLLSPPTYERIRRNVSLIRNRAVFEVADGIAAILRGDP